MAEFVPFKIPLLITIVCITRCTLGHGTAPQSAAGSEGNDVIKMRIISDPVSLAHGAVVTGHDEEEEETVDVAEVTQDRNVSATVPAAFSGPEHFRLYNGSCFTLEKSNFEYKICPFQNITQKELSFFRGRKRSTRIIGVWYEWIIEDESFAGWQMQNGEMCGDKPRSTTVDFACNEVAGLWDISEPHQCAYRAVFKLPQACHPDSLLVYPVLADELRINWDILETQRLEGDLTEKGYNIRLNDLMVLAGLVHNVTQRPTASTVPETTPFTAEVSSVPERELIVSGAAAGRTFTSLDQCQREYDALSKRGGEKGEEKHQGAPS